ncbi:N-lysine methyltransferase setd6-like isoform X2 [Myxocyprinus asiaticus]|uniref:N-lysine methyltransferase setd6-like isoform X2 n=1 Tax=Myxocyprinus asiaticus TaxID=70543 RepID=UPI002221D837|nr:N-lysine methyltransferase setd6-like isoform X2 [Myxocyprinus asiaticus]
MATDVKRPKIDDECCVFDPLKNFLCWCDCVNLNLSDKVYLSKEGTVAVYGMLAKEDIEEGHVVFSIPRDTLLHQGTTKIKKVLEDGKKSLESASGWVPLLLALLYEYTCPQSYWKPYLSLWPDFKMLDHPMFWSEDERDKLLKGTGIPEAVDTDLKKLQAEYNNIVLPFIKSHPDLWDPEKHNLELYKSLVAFVMAYSFQEPVEDEDEEEEKEPNPPMMVPMADMLNHVSKHNANLEYTPECLKMVAVRCIEKGEEVFNTYGQLANWQLLHMYGFAEPFPTNSNDTADIQMSSVYKAAMQETQREADQRLIKDKWNMLCEMEIVGEKGVFIFGQSGALTYNELHTTLKVLCMSVQEFEEFCENEGWEEDEEDEDDKMEQALSFDRLTALSPEWKRLLHAAAGFTLDSYSEDVDTDRRLLEDQGALAKLSSRERRALHVCYGQKNILQRLQQLTKPTS